LPEHEPSPPPALALKEPSQGRGAGLVFNQLRLFCHLI